MLQFDHLFSKNQIKKDNVNASSNNKKENVNKSKTTQNESKKNIEKNFEDIERIGIKK